MSSMRGPSVREGQVYVGNLPPDIKTREIEDIFYKFGKINFVNLKNGTGPNGPGPPFAFIEFEDPRDAEDAIRDRDGYNCQGYALRVELPRGISSNRPRGGWSFSERGRNGYGDSAGSRGGGSYDYGGNRPPPRRSSPVGPRRSDNRIIVTGLPKSSSKYELKDHLSLAGDISYVEVYGDGTGVVEFERYNDMKYAVKKMNESKFKTCDGETSYIHIKEDFGGRKDIRARSRSRSLTRRSRGSPRCSPQSRH